MMGATREELAWLHRFLRHVPGSPEGSSYERAMAAQVAQAKLARAERGETLAPYATTPYVPGEDPGDDAVYVPGPEDIFPPAW